MPLVVFTVFYIPVGLRILVRWLSKRSPKNDVDARIKRCHWFFVLAAIGFSVCMAKFVRITPLRWEKQGYLDVAKWLKENTAGTDIIAVPDRRMIFYAERKGVLFTGGRIPGSCKYAIRQFQSQGEMFLYGVKMKKDLSLVKNWRNEKIAIAIYQID